ncbi:MAG: AAA family ATPase [Planctomycetes bacterium]|nr:AAA family ATPase [Planctomycetota bacterium]
MIRKVVLRRFKRFDDEGVTFDLPGHVVLAGPNNTGKTTLLQAIAAWSLALNRWRELNDFQRHGGHYAKAPLARQAFHAVPLRVFDLLWTDRRSDGPIEITVQIDTGPSVTMELALESTEQIYVRPTRDVDPKGLKALRLDVALVPSLTGLAVAEPVYRPPKIEQLLGLGRPGEILRNLLVAACESETAWVPLRESIRRLFGFEILPPEAAGADILAEYAMRPDGPRFDIASGGSGFQQVLMLLTFLHSRPGSVLLIDEPDAHLHVILQDAIYGELRSVAARTGAQLVVATHSEVIIDSVDPSEICVVLTEPRMLADTRERERLVSSIRILSNTDIMLALQVAGVLYVEGHTDLEILRTWASLLDHPARQLLTSGLLCKTTVIQLRDDAPGVKAREHHEALKLVRDDLPGLELVDGDAHPDKQSTEITGRGLQRLRWRRYEIESYLIHPAALARFVEQTVGGVDAARQHVADLQRHFEDQYPPPFLRDPLGEFQFLAGVKARTDLIPPALSAAGIHGLPYTRYHEIAALMRPEEIHPEVVEKLDAILRAFPG